MKHAAIDRRGIFFWLRERKPGLLRLSFEAVLAMRGVTLSYETIREWWVKFGQIYAKGLRRRSSRRGDRRQLRIRFRRQIFWTKLLEAFLQVRVELYLSG